MVNGTEQCDDQNTIDTDGCLSDCTKSAGFTCTGNPSVCVTTCGDGIKAGLEECDDSNTIASDGCDSSCVVENGWICPSTCSVIFGDGIIIASHE